MYRKSVPAPVLKLAAVCMGVVALFFAYQHGHRPGGSIFLNALLAGSTSTPIAAVGATSEYAASRAPTDNALTSSADAQKIQDLAKSQGVVAAYNWLKANYSQNPVQGHDLAHIIGRLAYEQKGIKGFAVCDSSFGFGCYHGLLQVLIDDEGDKAIDAARVGCDGLTPEGHAVSCLHGIGHGIMVEKGTLPSAIAECSASFSSGEQPYCFDGAFMEYYTGIMKRQSGSLSVDFTKPWDLCLSMIPSSEGQCVRNATLFLLYSGRDSELPTAKACDSLSETLRPNCLQSFGLYVAQTANGDPGPVAKICDTFTSSDDRASCISAASQEFIFEGKSAATTKNLCNTLDPSKEQRCVSGVDEMVKLYGN